MLGILSPIFGLLLIQGIQAEEAIKDDFFVSLEDHYNDRFLSSNPAFPALKTKDQASILYPNADGSEDVPFMVPATPSIKIKDRASIKYSFADDVEDFPMIPGMSAIKMKDRISNNYAYVDESEDAPFMIPATPAIKIKDQASIKFAFADDVEDLAMIPAIPAIKIKDEISKNYANAHGFEGVPFMIPATPAIEIKDKASFKLAFGDDVEDLAMIPAIPAIKIKDQISNNYANAHGFEGVPFMIPATPAIEIKDKASFKLAFGDDVEDLAMIPAIPAIKIKDQISNNYANAHGFEGVPFMIPATPAIKIKDQASIKFGFADDVEDLAMIPAIPAIKIKDQFSNNYANADGVEDVPFMIPATPAFKIKDQASIKFGLADNVEDLAMIPAIPAIEIKDQDSFRYAYEKNEEDNPMKFSLKMEDLESIKLGFEDDAPIISSKDSIKMNNAAFPIPYRHSIKSIKDGMNTYGGRVIPATPAERIPSRKVDVVIKTSSEEEGPVDHMIGVNVNKCMSMALSLQRIPRHIGNLIDVATTALTNVMPFFKNVLGCTEENFMEMFSCLNSMEQDIRGFVMLADRLLGPPLNDLWGQVMKTKHDLNDCLLINYNSTNINSTKIENYF